MLLPCNFLCARAVISIPFFGHLNSSFQSIGRVLSMDFFYAKSGMQAQGGERQCNSNFFPFASDRARCVQVRELSRAQYKTHNKYKIRRKNQSNNFIFTNCSGTYSRMKATRISRICSIIFARICSRERTPISTSKT